MPARLALTLLLAAAVAAPAGALSGHTDRLRRTLRLPGNSPLTVSATVGDVTVAGWDRSDIGIEIVRRAPSSAQLKGIVVAVEADDAGARIAALQDGDRRDARLTGSVVVRVPFDQALAAVDLFEGQISLRDLRAGVRARVEHGSIQAASLAGRIRLETVIGDIRFDGATLSEAGMIRLRAFNGHIALGFRSAPADARILALSLDGTIQSDVPLQVRTTTGPRFAEATIGSGAPVVSLDVVHGNITILSGAR